MSVGWIIDPGSNQFNLNDLSATFTRSQQYPPPAPLAQYVSAVDVDGDSLYSQRYPNRQVTLVVEVQGSTASALETSLGQLQQKIGEINREAVLARTGIGGTLQHTTQNATTVTFDVCSVQMTPDLSETYFFGNLATVTLVFDCLPFGRGAEVALSSHTEATLPALVFTEASVTAYATAVANLTPLLYWRLDDTSGTTIADTSGNSRNGTKGTGITLGATGLLTGDSDKAVSGDGTANSKVTSSYNPFTGSITVCGWANATSLAAARNLFGGTGTANGPLLQVQTDGSVIWWSDLAAASQTWAAGAFPAATTVFWALTWNNSTKVSELFINNVSKGTKTSANAFNASPGTFTLAGSNASNGFLGTLDDTAIFSGVLSSTQLGTLYTSGTNAASAGIAGDVPGLGRLVITEAGAIDQHWIVWGVQSRSYSSAATAALQYEAEALTPLGAGAATAVGPAGASGGGSNTILANSLLQSYQAILSTQASGGGSHLTHVGEFRVLARAQVPTANTGAVSIALQWGVGDFRNPTTNTAVSLANTGGTWRLCDMGLVSIPQVLTGTQRWEGRILAKSTAAGDDVYIDHLLLIPTLEGSGEAAATSQTPAPSSYSVYDTFDQASATFATATMTLGGAWSSAGSTTDFTIDTTGHQAQRNTTSDASPRFGIAGTATFTSVVAQAKASVSNFSGMRGGVLLRYVDTSNYAAAYYENLKVYFVVVVAGVATTSTVATYTAITAPVFLIVTANDAGTWTVYGSTDGTNFTLAGSGQHTALATAGALATGKCGLYDLNSSGTSRLRTYDNFWAGSYAADAAVFASKQAEIRHNAVIRQDSTGSYWQPVSSYQGDYLLIPPAGIEGRTLRIIVKACRNDPATGADSAIDDITAQLYYTPRYLALPA